MASNAVCSCENCQRKAQGELRLATLSKQRSEREFADALEHAYAIGLSNSQIAANTGETVDCVRVRRNRRKAAA